MKSLKKPSNNALDVYTACLNTRRDKSLKARLECISAIIENAENQYKIYGEENTFFSIIPAGGVGSCVTTAEMGALYTEAFARKASKMRLVYDAIKLAPENDICPICAQRTVSTLDHYLPKAKNPSLAIMPLNLVPACFECNKIKGEYHPTNSTDQLLHPYFDVLKDERCLFVKIGETSPPSVTYFVEPPLTWDPAITERLKFHFRKFGLAKLYSTQAGTTLSGIATKLESAFERGGEPEVKFILGEDAASWGKFSKNSWQAALYQGLIESTWFCSGGFAQIA